ncbi:hypothetical protein [Polyangium sorediatum]|uniref:Lipoprotein n=1 Tax=Polyangium sorediatum TaxID=889274 RepID=A0ABT6NLS2_9BACT|nr:hypothetical protein [Polyangium sorediatum]MDI1429223.1 hypothetical protein [Polyangium sorediatum]
MNLARGRLYNRLMASLARLSVGSLAIFAVMGVLGCDAGGLLVVEDKENEPPPVTAKGHPATEIVAGGTQVRNGKYKLIYTMGQPTPQSVQKQPEGRRLNGGMPGATQEP